MKLFPTLAQLVRASHFNENIGCSNPSIGSHNLGDKENI